MYRYQIDVRLKHEGEWVWWPIMSFASERARDRVLAERQARYPKSKYRPYNE